MFHRMRRRMESLRCVVYGANYYMDG